MVGAALVYLVTYLGLAVFVAAIGLRFLKIPKMPLHLRWELYPVAHEPGEKARYGGSRLEEQDWWTKPQKQSRINELRAMLPEMLFLTAVFEHNRKLWWRTFPFHFGLYLLTGAAGLVGLGAIMELAGLRIIPGNGLGAVLYYVTPGIALAGLVLASIGAIGLLYARLFDADLTGYTPPAAIFNLLFFLLVLGVSWLSFIFVDTDLSIARAYVQDLVCFRLVEPIGGHTANPASLMLLELQVVLSVLLVAYIPLTHMSHFFIKWFTYHKIRWDDAPNLQGSEIEKKVLEQLQYPVTWSGAHLKADGKKNWADIATEEVD